jgi:putative glutamine amidotransferase
MGCTRPSPYSWHHQSIDRLADAATVVARAADGVIEAIDLPGHQALVAAVQWHPELSSDEDEDQQRLFDALVSASRNGSRG